MQHPHLFLPKRYIFGYLIYCSLRFRKGDAESAKRSYVRLGSSLNLRGRVPQRKIMSEFVHPATNDHFEPPIRMDGVVYCQVALRPPFIVTAPTGEDWRLYVIRGQNIVLHAPDLLSGDEPLENGTVIGMTGDAPHSFSSGSNDLASQSNSTWDETVLGSEADQGDVRILIGRIPQSSLPFLSLMGGMIRIDPSSHPDVTTRIGILMDWIAEETARNDAVTGEIVLRLADIITMEIGRIGRADSLLFSDRPKDAEYDERIWRAITTMCGAPERAWTVDSLAQVAGMSRSAFSARYHETVGQTPMRSLRRLRMHRAAIALVTTGPQSVAPLAYKMGYGSEAAFNRAFSQEFGCPPKRYGSRQGNASDKN
jgi:AraC-like DNA-binding protein